MNGYAVQDAWKKHESKQRREAREAECRATIDRAKQLVVEHLPDLPGNVGGYVDGWAVEAALQLHREGKPFNANEVRRRRGAMTLGDKTVAERDKENWK